MRLTADEARFAAAGVDYSAENGVAVFILPANPSEPLRPRQRVTVRLTDDKLDLFPERSSAQQRLLQLLGENQ